jgi:putative ABC transport system permease protein
MSLFVSHVNQDAGTTYTAATFRSTNQISGESSNNNATLLLAVNYLLLVLVLILLAYRQLYETKRIGVMTLHGYRTVRVWWLLSGRLIVSVLGVAALVCVVGALFVPGATPSFAQSVASSLVSWIIAALLVSLLTCLYISGIKLSNALKNRKDTRALFVVNTTLKAVCTIALVIAGSGLAVQYGQATHERAALGNWEATRDFGIFFPTAVGNDLGEIQAGLPGATTAEVYDLYPALNLAGALYIDATQLEPEAVAQSMPSGSYRSLQVNPNYLKQYPIQSSNGQPVQVSESETEWVVLAPESDRPHAAAIQKYFQQQRTGGDGYQTIAQAEKTTFGRTVSPAIANQKVRIIWTKDAPRVFTFDPNIAAGQGNTVSNPILQVMTMSNSTGVDRQNMITGSSNEAMKVHLEGGSASGTLRALGPELHTLRLDDNLTHLVTMNDYVLSQIAYLDQGVRNVVLVGLALALGMLALIVQGLSVTFERFSRRIVVRSLFGFSFWRKYREFLVIFAAAWLVQFLCAPEGVNPFGSVVDVDC